MDSNTPKFPFQATDRIDFSNLVNLHDVPERRPGKDGTFTAPAIIITKSPILPDSLSTMTVATDALILSAINQAWEENTTIVGVFDDGKKEQSFLSLGVEFAPGEPIQTDKDTVTFIVQGRRRVEVLEIFVDENDMLFVKAALIKIPKRRSKEVQALMRQVIKYFETFAQLSQHLPPTVIQFARQLEDPGELADIVTASINLKPAQMMEIITAVDPAERIETALRLIKHEVSLLELEAEINDRVQQELDQGQREIYLREKIEKLQQELNDGKSTDPDIRSLEDLLESKEYPEEVVKTAKKELERLKMTPSLSPESGMISTYLHWLLELPWNEETQDRLDIKEAQAILDKHHYGLPKAKDRILEYLAVRSLNPPKNRQPILCFVGPPGTGKTSLGKSIAEAMGRKFVRRSLGGVRDESEIRGHRRTYIGSMPGRILETISKVGVANPLFMLDEIDKLSSDIHGDPASALLEVLDPEQNYSFSDHYLEVPFDLSKVFFITTANTVQSIPPALLDRMEIIEFPGYIEEEKLEIARQFLIPEQLEENGLQDKSIEFTEDALRLIIKSYTYEAGVRNLERMIGAVLRKTARKLAEGEAIEKIITPELVEERLGPVEFFPITAELQDEVGMATAVAWTENGGEIMQIEVLVMPGKGNLQITGQVGEIMQESAQAALSYIKSKAENFQIPDSLFEETDVHIHVPEGSIPKDGPSAGITMAIAMTSAVLGVPTRHEVAMTGEITLRGRILPVGGVREKVLAAHRAGITTILLPTKNQKDLIEVPAPVLEQLRIVFVEHMDEVLKEALAGEAIYAKKPKETPPRHPRPTKNKMAQRSQQNSDTQAVA
ncbi:MAG TPA: endopeptidase La [Anaerolineaceae bacterium]|nr:endopeptidase La [Anaerolineaceae bacterium]